jgi:hypothetical protein
MDMRAVLSPLGDGPNRNGCIINETEIVIINWPGRARCPAKMPRTASRAKHAARAPACADELSEIVRQQSLFAMFKDVAKRPILLRNRL